MSTSMLSSCSPRCSAFGAGPLRRLPCTPRALRTTALGDRQHGVVASSSTAEADGPARLERSAIVLATGVLASGVFAGSCLAADSPESAAQAVQAAKLASDVLRPLFNIFTLLYIVRVPMTWYPEIDGTKMPWAIAYVPTEPILSATRKVVSLVNGVDVSPIVWVALISFLNEILLGPQGLLTLVQARGGL
ncbi:hypothetical protein TSOC_001645 [Tetrabaena socialis]|uniref:Protein COFACTOR ASSEMBLY OF COMPLEX C SUBUNIT B CCB3, chloroplastic n=1 Tax=Tetrabaena socialis TaxID=47790 RepID=A0A2J8AGD9_9CHLO|nr:hypothetical protein TSOC_001645 [Tetrabaena socialis]|eukprot:PNH11556.1 hypothetical protein TSOC_001645 [Tetrabaena socialis]